jgi:DNA-directed RNA polymerase specialized sigma24 family protein
VTTHWIARCEWDTTGWWVVTVDGIPNAVTQARRLGRVPADVVEVVKLATGEDVSPDEVEVVPVIAGEAGELAGEAVSLRREAVELDQRLHARTSAAARRLREEGFTVRDIGSVLGLSYQRAHQLIRADPHTETPVAGR